MNEDREDKTCECSGCQTQKFLDNMEKRKAQCPRCKTPRRISYYRNTGNYDSVLGEIKIKEYEKCPKCGY
jgi:hypothetical protein